jgi:HEAT repeat protein
MKVAVPIWAALLLLCPPTPAQTTSLDQAVAQVAKWEFDQNRQPLRTMSDLIAKAHGSAAETRNIERRFIELLQSDATLGGKDFVCKELSVMGSEASVPVLSGMLLEPKTAEIALYALERIPGQAADQALRDELPKVSVAKVRIGIVNTLGRRRDSGSVAALRPLAFGKEQVMAEPALFALAEIADAGAVQVLAEAQTKTSAALRVTAAEAYLKAADRRFERGDVPGAVRIYKELYGTGEPAIVRAQALRGLAVADGTESTPVLMQALRGDDARLQAIAIRALAKNSSKQLLAELPQLNDGGQVRVLGTLAEKGDTSVLPAFRTALKASSQPVRVAALEGLGRIGNAAVVPTLARIAASDDEAERSAARNSLASMRGSDVDRAVTDGIASADLKVQLEMIRAAGERGITAATPALLKMARESNADVRRESLKALGDTVSAGDVSGLVTLVVTPAQAGDREEAARSLGVVLRRSDPASSSNKVISAYSSVSDVEARAALVQVMGQTGNAEALPLLEAALKDQNTELKQGAILGLTEWPDDTPVTDLLEAARTASSPSQQVLALRGVIRLIPQPGSHRTVREKVQLLTQAMGLAKHAEEKRAILALLPALPINEALDLANASVNDSEVGTAAKAAATRLERTVKQ